MRQKKFVKKELVKSSSQAPSNKRQKLSPLTIPSTSELLPAAIETRLTTRSRKSISNETEAQSQSQIITKRNESKNDIDQKNVQSSCGIISQSTLSEILTMEHYQTRSKKLMLDSNQAMVIKSAAASRKTRVSPMKVKKISSVRLNCEPSPSNTEFGATKLQHMVHLSESSETNVPSETTPSSCIQSQSVFASYKSKTDSKPYSFKTARTRSMETAKSKPSQTNQFETASTTQDLTAQTQPEIPQATQVQTAPFQSETSQPILVQTTPSQPETHQVTQVQIELAQPETPRDTQVQTASSQSETSQPILVQATPSEPETPRATQVQIEPAQPETPRDTQVQTASSQSETCQPILVQTEPLQSETPRAIPVQAMPSQPETPRATQVQIAPAQPETLQATPLQNASPLSKPCRVIPDSMKRIKRMIEIHNILWNDKTLYNPKLKKLNYEILMHIKSNNQKFIPSNKFIQDLCIQFINEYESNMSIRFPHQSKQVQTLRSQPETSRSSNLKEIIKEKIQNFQLIPTQTAESLKLLTQNNLIIKLASLLTRKCQQFGASKFLADLLEKKLKEEKFLDEKSMKLVTSLITYLTSGNLEIEESDIEMRKKNIEALINTLIDEFAAPIVIPIKFTSDSALSDIASKSTSDNLSLISKKVTPESQSIATELPQNETTPLLFASGSTTSTPFIQNQNMLIIELATLLTSYPKQIALHRLAVDLLKVKLNEEILLNERTLKLIHMLIKRLNKGKQNGNPSNLRHPYQQFNFLVSKLIDELISPTALPSHTDTATCDIVFDPVSMKFVPRFQSVPASSASIQSVPVLYTPISNEPKLSVPALEAPVSIAPIQSLPVLLTPISKEPKLSVTALSVPIPTAPKQSVPALSTAVSNASNLSVPVLFTPVSFTPQPSKPSVVSALVPTAESQALSDQDTLIVNLTTLLAKNGRKIRETNLLLNVLEVKFQEKSLLNQESLKLIKMLIINLTNRGFGTTQRKMFTQELITKLIDEFLEDDSARQLSTKIGLNNKPAKQTKTVKLKPITKKKLRRPLIRLGYRHAKMRKFLVTYIRRRKGIRLYKGFARKIAKSPIGQFRLMRWARQYPQVKQLVIQSLDKFTRGMGKRVKLSSRRASRKKRQPIHEKIYQMAEKRKIDFCTPDSVLLNIQLDKYLCLVNFTRLPAYCQHLLVQMLPANDQQINKFGVIEPTEDAFSNTWFRKAIREFLIKLKTSKFIPRYRRKLNRYYQKCKKRMDPHKIEHFENCYMEEPLPKAKGSKYFVDTFTKIEATMEKDDESTSIEEEPMTIACKELSGEETEQLLKFDYNEHLKNETLTLNHRNYGVTTRLQKRKNRIKRKRQEKTRETPKLMEIVTESKSELIVQLIDKEMQTYKKEVKILKYRDASRMAKNVPVVEEAKIDIPKVIKSPQHKPSSPIHRTRSTTYYNEHFNLLPPNTRKRRKTTKQQQLEFEEQPAEQPEQTDLIEVDEQPIQTESAEFKELSVKEIEQLGLIEFNKQSVEEFEQLKLVESEEISVKELEQLGSIEFKEQLTEQLEQIKSTEFEGKSVEQLQQMESVENGTSKEKENSIAKKSGETENEKMKRNKVFRRKMIKNQKAKLKLICVPAEYIPSPIKEKFRTKMKTKMEKLGEANVQNKLWTENEIWQYIHKKESKTEQMQTCPAVASDIEVSSQSDDETRLVESCKKMIVDLAAILIKESQPNEKSINLAKIMENKLTPKLLELLRKLLLSKIASSKRTQESKQLLNDHLIRLIDECNNNNLTKKSSIYTDLCDVNKSIIASNRNESNSRKIYKCSSYKNKNSASKKLTSNVSNRNMENKPIDNGVQKTAITKLEMFKKLNICLYEKVKSIKNPSAAVQNLIESMRIMCGKWKSGRKIPLKTETFLILKKLIEKFALSDAYDSDESKEVIDKLMNELNEQYLYHELGKEKPVFDCFAKPIDGKSENVVSFKESIEPISMEKFNEKLVSTKTVYHHNELKELNGSLTLSAKIITQKLFTELTLDIDPNVPSQKLAIELIRIRKMMTQGRLPSDSALLLMKNILDIKNGDACVMPIKDFQNQIVLQQQLSNELATFNQLFEGKLQNCKDYIKLYCALFSDYRSELIKNVIESLHKFLQNIINGNNLEKEWKNVKQNLSTAILNNNLKLETKETEFFCEATQKLIILINHIILRNKIKHDKKALNFVEILSEKLTTFTNKNDKLEMLDKKLIQVKAALNKDCDLSIISRPIVDMKIIKLTVNVNNEQVLKLLDILLQKVTLTGFHFVTVRSLIAIENIIISTNDYKYLDLLTVKKLILILLEKVNTGNTLEEPWLNNTMILLIESLINRTETASSLSDVSKQLNTIYLSKILIDILAVKIKALSKHSAYKELSKRLFANKIVKMWNMLNTGTVPRNLFNKRLIVMLKRLTDENKMRIKFASLLREINYVFNEEFIKLKCKKLNKSSDTIKSDQVVFKPVSSVFVKHGFAASSALCESTILDNSQHQNDLILSENPFYLWVLSKQMGKPTNLPDKIIEETMSTKTGKMLVHLFLERLSTECNKYEILKSIVQKLKKHYETGVLISSTVGSHSDQFEKLTVNKEVCQEFFNQLRLALPDEMIPTLTKTIIDPLSAKKKRQTDMVISELDKFNPTYNGKLILPEQKLTTTILESLTDSEESDDEEESKDVISLCTKTKASKLTEENLFMMFLLNENNGRLFGRFRKEFNTQIPSLPSTVAMKNIFPVRTLFAQYNQSVLSKSTLLPSSPNVLTIPSLPMISHLPTQIEPSTKETLKRLNDNFDSENLTKSFKIAHSNISNVSNKSVDNEIREQFLQQSTTASEETKMLTSTVNTVLSTTKLSIPSTHCSTLASSNTSLPRVQSVSTSTVLARVFTKTPSRMPISLAPIEMSSTSSQSIPSVPLSQPSMEATRSISFTSVSHSLPTVTVSASSLISTTVLSAIQPLNVPSTTLTDLSSKSTSSAAHVTPSQPLIQPLAKTPQTVLPPIRNTSKVQLTASSTDQNAVLTPTSTIVLSSNSLPFTQTITIPISVFSQLALSNSVSPITVASTGINTQKYNKETLVLAFKMDSKYQTTLPKAAVLNPSKVTSSSKFQASTPTSTIAVMIPTSMCHGVQSAVTSTISIPIISVSTTTPNIAPQITSSAQSVLSSAPLPQVHSRIVTSKALPSAAFTLVSKAPTIVSSLSKAPSSISKFNFTVPSINPIASGTELTKQSSKMTLANSTQIPFPNISQRNNSELLKLLTATQSTTPLTLTKHAAQSPMSLPQAILDSKTLSTPDASSLSTLDGIDPFDFDNPETIRVFGEIGINSLDDIDFDDNEKLIMENLMNNHFELSPSSQEQLFNSQHMAHTNARNAQISKDAVFKKPAIPVKQNRGVKRKEWEPSSLTDMPQVNIRQGAEAQALFTANSPMSNSTTFLPPMALTILGQAKSTDCTSQNYQSLPIMQNSPQSIDNKPTKRKNSKVPKQPKAPKPPKIPKIPKPAKAPKEPKKPRSSKLTKSKPSGKTTEAISTENQTQMDQQFPKITNTFSYSAQNPVLSTSSATTYPELQVTMSPTSNISQQSALPTMPTPKVALQPQQRMSVREQIQAMELSQQSMHSMPQIPMMEQRQANVQTEPTMFSHHLISSPNNSSLHVHIADTQRTTQAGDSNYCITTSAGVLANTPRMNVIPIQTQPHQQSYPVKKICTDTQSNTRNVRQVDDEIDANLNLMEADDNIIDFTNEEEVDALLQRICSDTLDSFQPSNTTNKFLSVPSDSQPNARSNLRHCIPSGTLTNPQTSMQSSGFSETHFNSHANLRFVSTGVQQNPQMSLRPLSGIQQNSQINLSSSSRIQQNPQISLRSPSTNQQNSQMSLRPSTEIQRNHQMSLRSPSGIQQNFQMISRSPSAIQRNPQMSLRSPSVLQQNLQINLSSPSRIQQNPQINLSSPSGFQQNSQICLDSSSEVQNSQMNPRFSVQSGIQQNAQVNFRLPSLYKISQSSQINRSSHIYSGIQQNSQVNLRLPVPYVISPCPQTNLRSSYSHGIPQNPLINIHSSSSSGVQSSVPINSSSQVDSGIQQTPRLTVNSSVYSGIQPTSQINLRFPVTSVISSTSPINLRSSVASGTQPTSQKILRFATPSGTQSASQMHIRSPVVVAIQQNLQKSLHSPVSSAILPRHQMNVSCQGLPQCLDTNPPSTLPSSTQSKLQMEKVNCISTTGVLPVYKIKFNGMHASQTSDNTNLCASTSSNTNKHKRLRTEEQTSTQIEPDQDSNDKSSDEDVEDFSNTNWELHQSQPEETKSTTNPISFQLFKDSMGNWLFINSDGSTEVVRDEKKRKLHERSQQKSRKTTRTNRKERPIKPCRAAAQLWSAWTDPLFNFLSRDDVTCERNCHFCRPPANYDDIVADTLREIEVELPLPKTYNVTICSFVHEAIQRERQTMMRFTLQLTQMFRMGQDVHFTHMASLLTFFLHFGHLPDRRRITGLTPELINIDQEIDEEITIDSERKMITVEDRESEVITLDDNNSFDYIDSDKK